jgi:hypothetical protein
MDGKRESCKKRAQQVTKNYEIIIKNGLQRNGLPRTKKKARQKLLQLLLCGIGQAIALKGPLSPSPTGFDFLSSMHAVSRTTSLSKVCFKDIFFKNKPCECILSL